MKKTLLPPVHYLQRNAGWVKEKDEVIAVFTSENGIEVRSGIVDKIFCRGQVMFTSREPWLVTLAYGRIYLGWTRSRHLSIYSPFIIRMDELRYFIQEPEFSYNWFNRSIFATYAMEIVRLISLCDFGEYERHMKLVVEHAFKVAPEQFLAQA